MLILVFLSFGSLGSDFSSTIEVCTPTNLKTLPLSASERSPFEICHLRIVGVQIPIGDRSKISHLVFGLPICLLLGKSLSLELQFRGNVTEPVPFFLIRLLNFRVLKLAGFYLRGPSVNW